MKDSKTWWAGIKNDPTKLADWLQRQFRGEVTAAGRIAKLADDYAASPKDKILLLKVAADENRHALWILDLLEARGIDPGSIADAEKRYWAQTLPGIEDLETGAAVGAHAEGMRLERIRAIAEDSDAPYDIHEVFTRILRDEEFHEKAFLSLTTPEALDRTRGNHSAGREVLGLEA